MFLVHRAEWGQMDRRFAYEFPPFAGPISVTLPCGAAAGQ